MIKIVAAIAIGLFCAGSAFANGSESAAKGLVAYKRGDFSAATTHYTDAIKSGDLSGDALFKAYVVRSLSYEEAGERARYFADQRQAARMYREQEIAKKTELIEADPGNAEAYLGRAQIYLHFTRFTPVFHGTIIDHPSQRPAIVNSARGPYVGIYRQVALADLNRAIALKPDFVKAYVARGKLYESRRANR